MIYTDKDIKELGSKGFITPYEPTQVNANSYDVRLGETLKVYGTPCHPVKWLYLKAKQLLGFTVNPVDFIELPCEDIPLDCKSTYPSVEIKIPAEGIVLNPNVGYLGYTLERTETNDCVPIIYGKSSLGRRFLLVHFTAGFGDLGFRGHWTLELMAIHPLRVYAGQRIGQIVFFKPTGDATKRYDERETSKYKEQGNEPVTSRI